MSCNCCGLRDDHIGLERDFSPSNLWNDGLPEEAVHGKPKAFGASMWI
jgi:hypothetical protein